MGNSLGLAEYIANQKITFPITSDQDLSLSKIFGIKKNIGQYHIIVNRKGTIVFSRSFVDQVLSRQLIEKFIK